MWFIIVCELQPQHLRKHLSLAKWSLQVWGTKTIALALTVSHRWLSWKNLTLKENKLNRKEQLGLGTYLDEGWK